MNNFKKIGMTALAASLVSTSVFAGEVTVSWWQRQLTSKTTQDSTAIKLLELSLSQWETNLHFLVQVN